MSKADLALLALFAEDSFQAARKKPGADLSKVDPDPRLSPCWRVIGTLTGTDALLRFGRHEIGAKTVFYGWLLKNRRGQRVLAIRGTAGRLEWLIDALFAPRTAHPVAGKVESGFWRVYSSMRIDGKPISDIAQGSITIVGHSLGGALATYAALELAKAGAKVRGVFIASPHPGDKDFCRAFGAAVPNHVLCANTRDVIPRLPLFFGYSDVPNVERLSAKESGVRITGGPAGQHHVLSYVALMDRKALKTFKPLPCDQAFLDCIHIDGSSSFGETP